MKKKVGRPKGSKKKAEVIIGDMLADLEQFVDYLEARVMDVERRLMRVENRSSFVRIVETTTAIVISFTVLLSVTAFINYLGM